MFTRNRLREQLLPHLRAEYNAGVDETLVRLAEQAGELQSLVEAQAHEVLEASREWVTSRGFALNVATLQEHSPILVREVLRLAWREAHFPEQAMSREWWVELANLAGANASEVVLNLPGRVRSALTGGFLVVER